MPLMVMRRIARPSLAALLVLGCSRSEPESKSKDAAKAPPAQADAKAPDPAPANAAAKTWTFDDEEGDTPAGFTLTETGGVGTPATWKLVEHPEAPSPPTVFGITQTTNGKPTYNVALVEGSSYADVDISVMVHPGTGELDQGGGPIWRVKDANNYYIARWNPLEKNVAFYVVEKGVRETLLKAPLETTVDAWHELRVVHTGSDMQCFFDDEPLMTFADARITGAGRVGLWTKADAATLFDDLSVTTP